MTRRTGGFTMTLTALFLTAALVAGVPAAPAAAASLRLTPGPVAVPGLAGGPVTVGDRQSLGRLAVRGLASVALDAVSGLPGLNPAPGRLALSDALSLTPTVLSLYSRVVELADRYQVSILPDGGPASVLTPAGALTSPPTRRAWPRLAVPDLRLSAAAGASGALAEVAGIQLSGRLAPPAPGVLTDDADPAYDLVATVPVVPSRVDVSAHYRLVDVDRLAGIDSAAGSPAAAPQTVGVDGKLALTGATQLKAGYEVTRDGGLLTGVRADAGVSLRLDSRTDLSAGLAVDRRPAEGSQVLTSVNLGYQLSSDAALRASYTLINFGTGAQAAGAERRHEASAELSLRF